MAAKVRFGRRTINVPGNRAVRTVVGGAMVPLGLVGFLPVVGFWMVPAGLLILSVDSPTVRRFNRRTTVKVMRWWNGSRSRGAEPDSPS